MVVKLTRFLLIVILSLSRPAHADDAKLMAMANQIVDSTFKVELDMQNMLISMKKSLNGLPLALDEETNQCLTDYTSPKLRTFFSDILFTALDAETITLGAELTSKPSIKNSKAFILASNYCKEAKSHNIPLQAYRFMMAAQHSDNASDQQQLLDVAEWLELNDSKIFNAFLDKTEDYTAIIRSSVHNCLGF